jgi:hypothetical protein
VYGITILIHATGNNYADNNNKKRLIMMDIHELREELLEQAMEHLDCKFRTQKKFAKMFFEYKLKQGIPIDNYMSYMPQIYTPQEAIDLAKAMEAYVVGGNGK